QLEERATDLRQRLIELDARARRALAAGERTGARDVLFLHEAAGAELGAMTRQRNELEAEEQRLSLGEQRLAALIDKYHARERLILVRHDAAEAGVRIAEALAGLSRELGRPDLLDAETKIRDLEARAAAIDELAAAGILDLAGDPGLPTSSDAALAEAVDRRLAALEGELDASAATGVTDVDTRWLGLRRG